MFKRIFCTQDRTGGTREARPDIFAPEAPVCVRRGKSESSSYRNNRGLTSAERTARLAAPGAEPEPAPPKKLSLGQKAAFAVAAVVAAAPAAAVGVAMCVLLPFIAVPVLVLYTLDGFARHRRGRQTAEAYRALPPPMSKAEIREAQLKANVWEREPASAVPEIL